MILCEYRENESEEACGQKSRKGGAPKLIRTSYAGSIGVVGFFASEGKKRKSVRIQASKKARGEKEGRQGRLERSKKKREEKERTKLTNPRQQKEKEGRTFQIHSQESPSTKNQGRKGGPLVSRKRPLKDENRGGWDRSVQCDGALSRPTDCL